MQTIYRYYDKGDISYGQLSYMLKEMNLEVPPEGKISNFKEFQKQVKQTKQVPQITINLKHQLKCTIDDVESPKVGRRFVTLGDSPMMKNENSYLFKNGKRDEKSMSRDARLSSNNIYIEQKKKVIPGIVTNGNILTHQDSNIESLTQSARGIQSYRKNDSSVKIGNGLFSQRENQKKDLVKVTNKEQKGSGNIIQNQVTLAVKPKLRLQLESNIKFTE